ncbi:MAG: nucleotidyltransferase family protein [Anaeromyxobacteraceae bacterium]
MPARIAIDRERLARFCRRNDLKRLALFGPVLREDLGPDCATDVLVEVGPATPGGFDFLGLEMELEGILGRRVALHTPASLSRYLRDDVLREAETVYLAP